MSQIDVRPVEGKRDLDRFITLPNRLQAADPHYVAPLTMERRESLSSAKNPLFKHVQAQFFLAWRGGVPVGRISAQSDDRVADCGHFGLLAGEDDPEVFRALFAAAEGWLKAKGRTEARGPFNLSINEECGLLIDGFDTPPMLFMPHDAPYVAARVEEQGYAKAMDLFAYLHLTSDPFPKAIERIIERPRPPEVVVRHLDWKRYDEEIATVIDIFNDAWSENWGFVPFSPEELDHLAKSLKLLIDERLLWIVEVSGRAAAFGVGLPNLNEMIADFDGKLLPFNWAKLVWRLKRVTYTSGRVALMGVRKECARSFLGRAMPIYIFDEFRKEGRRRGIERVEMSWVLESNLPMRHMGEALSNGSAYKTYRIYRKALA